VINTGDCAADGMVVTVATIAGPWSVGIPPKTCWDGAYP
jgi:hypothetical protein